MKISGSFNIGDSKIDRSRAHQGKTDLFHGFTFSIDTDKVDKFGNCMIVFEGQSKEEREEGRQARIVGSGRIFGGKR